MCNQHQRMQPFVPYWSGKTLEQIFSPEILQHVDTSRVQPGKCLSCMKPLTNNEMWPAGKTPRCMCSDCYERIIVSQINYRCLITQEPLSSEKIQLQQQNPREVMHNLADGYASDVYTAMANIIFDNGSIITPSHINCAIGNGPALLQQPQEQPHLLPHLPQGDQLSFPELNRSPLPVRVVGGKKELPTHYNGKPIRYI